MNVREYITQKFHAFGIQLSEADILDMLLASSMGEDVAVDGDNIEKLAVSICKFIPTLLLHPTSVGESGFSLSKAQSSDIEKYYNYQCKRLGLSNELKPKITFL